MKTIKIIELLNKIANGENVPQEIRYNGDKYSRKYDKIENCYYYDGYYNTLSSIIDFDPSNLNDEIEIIEDDETIRPIDISEWNEITYEYNWELLKGDFNKNSNTFVNKINEIIDYINKEK